MEMEQLESEQDIDLMPYNQVIDPLDSTNPEAEQVLSDQGDTEILEDNPEVEMHNISFDKLQHRVVQSRRVTTLDVNTSHVQFKK